MRWNGQFPISYGVANFLSRIFSYKNPKKILQILMQIIQYPCFEGVLTCNTRACNGRKKKFYVKEMCWPKWILHISK